MAFECAPQPKNVFDLLHETKPIGDLMAENDEKARSIQQQQEQQFTGEDPFPFNRLRYLPTGLHSLDRHLKGGLRVGTITEVVGQAGSGKTQVAMQLCVMAARYGQGCVFIDTEKKLSLLRLQEIADKRAIAYDRAHGGLDPPTGSRAAEFSYNQHNNSFLSAASLSLQEQHEGVLPASPSSPSDNIPYQRSDKVLDNVTVLTPSTMQDLMSALSEVEELVMDRNFDAASHPDGPFPIRLLIVDSIAAPTKRGAGCESAVERASAIFQCAQRLKQLAHQLQLAILVINQVYAVHRRNNDNHSDINESNFKAALGPSWYHCVSTRIMLEQQQQQQHGNSGPVHDQSTGGNQQNLNAPTNAISSKTTRMAHIEKSVLSGRHSACYEIVGAGVVDVERAISSP